jgi:hydrogenase 3 maturation protease
MGNRLRGDDGAGSLIAELLARRGLDRAFDCGEAPENFLGTLHSHLPCDICVLDAVDFDASPGTVRVFEGTQFGAQAVSTHAAGLGPLMEFLRAEGGVLRWVLAIQPARVAFGDDLSDPVRRAVEQIVSSPVWFE